MPATRSCIWTRRPIRPTGSAGRAIPSTASSCTILGESPVLLLDDVLSELDGLRQDYVLNSIGGGQVLITCCASEEVRRKTGGKLIYVEGGKLRECTST